MNGQVTRRVGLLLSLLAFWSSSANADAVVIWNENAARSATAACLHVSGNGLAESRMYAMVHAAIHDAVNAIDRRSRPYAFDASVNPAASVDAAVAAAARDVLVSVLTTLPESPECRASGIAQTEASYAAALAAVPDGAAKLDGIAVGRAAAATIIALRSSDGSDQPLADPAYPQGTQPGEWRFTPGFPFAFLPRWGEVTPFVLHHSSQFRPPPPYQLRSAPYAADYDEVKRLGGDGINTPSARTPDQTEIGLFWLESSPLSWNRLARAVALERGLDVWENARLFALLNLAMADGYIASWDAKYHYNFWRPVTAIQLGDSDGNPRTDGDPAWTPLELTYPIPDHPSGHAVQGGVGAEILKLVLGTDDVAFTACSTSLPAGSNCADPGAIFRAYTSFSQAADENAASRIYVGIHFGQAVDDGVKQGRKIAAYAVHRLLKPVQ